MRHVTARLALTAFAIASFILLTNCGGGNSGGSIQPLNPQFTSVPPTNASEGVTYSYNPVITGDGGAGILALPEAPAGATLSGAGVTWVPTPEQSRKANNFTLKFTAQAGGTATQSWTVTPSGTVRVSWIDTTWNESGSSATPFDWASMAMPAAALVPQPDGTLKTVDGGGGADGKLTIPDIPGGYFWLRLAPSDYFWTNSSTVDIGADYNVPPGLVTVSSGPTIPTTTLDFNVTGIEPVMGSSLKIDLDPYISMTSFMFGSSGTSYSWSMDVPFSFDWTKIKTGRALEYKPATFGTISGSVLGPATMLTNLTIIGGTTNNIDVPLTPSPQKSVNLSIKGSAWPPLFAHVAPGPATMVTTPFNLSVDPDVPVSANRYVLAGRSIRLLQPSATLSGGFGGGLLNGVGITPTFMSRCGGMATLPLLLTTPVIDTDLNAGTVQYGDPFPAEWTRYFTICQQATVDIPSVDGTSTQQFWITNGATSSIPTAPVEPMVGPVEGPTINDQSLFTPATLTGTNFTLKWTKPSLGTPTGYVVRVMTGMSRNGVSAYVTVANLVTSKTTVPVPPGVLLPGNKYLFMITTILDGRANIELSPRRTGVPIANADIISAPITIAAQ